MRVVGAHAAYPRTPTVGDSGRVLVFDGDFPDPYVLRVEDGYLAYSTQSGGSNVQVASSTDLRTWTLLADALPVLPGWARPGFTWSPAVLRRGAQYVMYVAVRPKAYERQAISACVSDRAEGPFSPALGGPLVFQRSRGGSIDPDPFNDAENTAHLLWKSDGELVGQPAMLWQRRLSDDGLRLVGRRRRLTSCDQEWERPLIEAPSLWAAGGRWFLFYSAGTWRDAGYGIGYAVADSLRGPYRKPPGLAWFSGDSGTAGPGGQCVVTDPSGAAYLAYHAWSVERVGYENGGARRLHIDRLDLDANGVPVLTPHW